MKRGILWKIWLYRRLHMFVMGIVHRNRKLKAEWIDENKYHVYWDEKTKRLEKRLKERR